MDTRWGARTTTIYVVTYEEHRGDGWVTDSAWTSESDARDRRMVLYGGLNEMVCVDKVLLTDRSQYVKLVEEVTPGQSVQYSSRRGTCYIP